MKRFWHYVKRNEGSETIQSCIFVDCETIEVQKPNKYTGHQLHFGWAASVKRKGNGEWAAPKWKRFTNVDEFWLWAMCQTIAGKKTWVWCHNSNFDYPVLDAFLQLPLLGWQLKSAIIDGPPTIVKYISGRKTLVLVDTLNLWRMPLKKLGKKVGLEKLERPKEWTGNESDDIYARRDVEIIRKAVCEWSDFLRDNDMGGFAPTAASQAMRTFRHKYMDDAILIDANLPALDLARNAYHGGRCEAGFIGRLTQPVYYVDLNSAYPYAMSYAEMPLRIKGVSRGTQVYHLPKLLKTYCLIAHVKLNTQHAAYAVVRNHKLMFPVGRFDAYLTSPEIEYALRHGCIEEVYSCACYEKGVPFRKFAIDLYAQKENAARAGRTVEAEQWKLLLNSFYGKWGQSGRKWVEIGKCDRKRFEVIPDIDAQTLKKTLVRYFGGLKFARSDEGESSESHPAIAAHITAHVRMILWAIIEKLPAKQYFYCDTDGLLIGEEGFNSLREGLDEYELGKLKHVKTYSDVTIYGCKDLLLDGKQTLKGIRDKAQCLGDGKYRQLKWTSLRGLLRAGSLNMPLTTFVDKTLSRLYNKGVIGPDGFVSPLHLSE